jgi:hypothetical protein
MANKKIESVYYNDGCVLKKDDVYISSKLHSLDPDNYDFSRMSFYEVGEWGYHDLNWNVVSVCYINQVGLYALSNRGDISTVNKDGISEEKITDGGEYGATKQIRPINNQLYVCGDQGQVYRREKNGQWVHFDEGIFAPKISATGLDLNSIDGTGEDDLYVVGYHGRIYHRDQNGWKELESPTNCHLERVRCISKDEVYICGNSGIFFRGNKDGWEDFSVKGMESNFWGLEKYEDKIYLATLEGLYVFDGKMVTELSTGLHPEIGGYRLHANDGVLWSFGADDLAYFDGKKWTRVQHPDNPPPNEDE